MDVDGKTAGAGTRKFCNWSFLGRLVAPLVVSLVLALGTTAAHAVIPASERQVLLNIYISTNGAGWFTNTGWNSAVSTECNWYGVTCNVGESHVTEISLGNNNLAGTIPSLAALTALELFVVSSNQLTGPIPSLAGMTTLMSFYVDGNQLTGAIPPLAGLTSLMSLSVGFNNLTGSIPSLAGLTNLANFNARQNGLTGTIPPLTGLSKLEGFDVSYNKLTGSLPAFTGLTHLAIFQATFNKLTGAIPDFTDCGFLYDFSVGFNLLTGPLPSLAGLTGLTYFNIELNQIAGPLPALTGLTSLFQFSAYNNKLTGSIPSLAGLTSLSSFNVSNNLLTGSIPPLTGLTNLVNFSAYFNQLSGSIPSLAGLTKLAGFAVFRNQLTGSIPPLTGLTGLQGINVKDNKLTGDVPAVPSPNALQAGASQLCPNYLNHTANAAWDTATGNSPWFGTCTAQPIDVTYDGNGNTGGSPPVDPATYAAGATVTVLGNTGNLVKSGYTFAAWNTAADGGGTNYAAGATFAIGASGVTLYAKWTPITFGVTYNGNANTGGSVPTDSGTYAAGATVTVLGNTGNLVKSGYSFAGWNTAANGSGTNYAGGATFTMGVANVTLYAKWTLVTYSVTYNGNGSTGGSAPVDSGTYATGATVTVLGNTGILVKSGSTFAGWNTAANGTGTYYNPAETFAMPFANVTLYAQWAVVGATPTLQTAKSRKVHGSAGTFNLPLVVP